MAAMTNFLENKLIDHLFRNVPYTAPATLHIGLFTAMPTSDGASAGTEVSTTGTNYARYALTSNTTNWAATDATGSTAATSGGTSGTTSNNTAITYNTPGATNWGTVVGMGIWDASTGGNLLIFASLTASKTVNSGDAAPSFPAAALSFQVDN